MNDAAMNDTAMNDTGNAAYYSSRARQEDEAARTAVNPLAATIHHSLASRYRAKASGFNIQDVDDGQRLSIVRD